MGNAAESVARAFSWLLGAAVFWGLIWFLIRTHTAQWRKVAAQFRGTARGPEVAHKVPETIVFVERDPDDRTIFAKMRYRQYAGVRVAIHETGMAFRLIPPFSILADPLFVRFDDMEISPTSWMLWRDPYAIRLRGLAGIEIILGRDTVRWIHEHVDRAA